MERSLTGSPGDEWVEPDDCDEEVVHGDSGSGVADVEQQSF